MRQRFIIAVVVFFTIMGLLTFFSYGNRYSKADFDAFFQSTGKFTTTQEMGRTVFRSFSEHAPLDSSQVILQKLSAFNGVYYNASSNQNVVTLTGNTVHFGEGVFLVFCDDIFTKQTFVLGSIQFIPKSSGIFLIQNTKEARRIYSYNIFMDIAVDNQKNPAFTLYPSMLFAFHDKYTQEIKSADMLQIASLTTLEYIDPLDKAFTTLFGEKNIQHMISVGINDIDQRKNQAQDLAARIRNIQQFGSDEKGNNGNALLQNETLQMLLVNQGKLYSVLQQQLAQQIVSLYRMGYAGKEKEYKNTLSQLYATLRTMQSTNAGLHISGMETFKKAFLVNYMSIDQNERLPKHKKLTALADLPPIIASVSNLQEGSEFLSQSFYDYDFVSPNKNTLSNALIVYTKQYVFAGKYGVNQIFPFIFFIANNIYGTMEPSEDVFQVAATQFDKMTVFVRKNRDQTTFLNLFRYEKLVFDSLYEHLARTYLTSTSHGLPLLRTEYELNGEPKIPDFVINGLSDTNKSLGRFITAKRLDFYSSDADPTPPKYAQYVSTYDDFYESYLHLGTLSYIFSDYLSYKKSLGLTPESQRAQGIVLSQEIPMSLDIVRNYLSQFNELDPSSVRVLNKFELDQYYIINVTIAGKPFRFKLNPKGNIVYDLVYTDNGHEVQLFKNISLALDQKEKAFKQMLGSVTNPEKRYFYDFKNIFLIMYLQQNQAGVSGDESDLALKPSIKRNTTDMALDMQLFVQKELLDKDFSYIKQTIPIGFSDIFAEVKDGTYQIIIKPIRLTLSSKERAFQGLFSAEYDFLTHSFTKMQFEVDTSTREQVDLHPLRLMLLPQKLGVLEINDKFDNITIGTAIKKCYNETTTGGNQDTATFDLSSKTLTIGNQTFIIPIQTGTGTAN